MGRPCEEERYWPAYSCTNKRTGKTWAYEAQTTRPLQDHREDGKGITIHPLKDNRAQPWVELVRANIHSKDITYLPPKKASHEEICEFLFLVLAKENIKGSKLDLDNKPWLASLSIMRWHHWRGSGKLLRKLSLEQWCNLCPGSWQDVLGDVHYNSREDRDAVGEHIFSIVNSLVIAEQMSFAHFIARCRAENLLESVSLSFVWQTSFRELICSKSKREKKLTRFARFKNWLLCTDNDFGYAVSDTDTLPEYTEKEIPEHGMMMGKSTFAFRIC